MAEVTYFVALSFVAADDGVAAANRMPQSDRGGHARRGIISQAWTYWRCGV